MNVNANDGTFEGKYLNHKLKSRTLAIVHTATAPVLQDEGPNQLAATLLSINEKLNQPLNSTKIPTVEAEVTQFYTSTPSLSNSHGNTSGSSYMRYKIRS